MIGRGRSELMLTEQADQSDQRVLPYSTPRRRSTASARSQEVVPSGGSSKDGRTLSARKTSGSLTTTQTELMEIAKAELTNSCNETDVHNLPLELAGDPEDDVLSNILKYVKLWTLDERRSYENICNALNAVVSASDDFRYPLFSSKFEVYDKQMADGIEGAHALKPDLLLTFKPMVAGKLARWRDVFIAVEVKSDWTSLINQAATYGRALFHARKTRTFSVVIGINHQTRDARFLFFHRGGLTSSRLLKLEKADDLKQFYRTLRGMLHWATPEEAGYLAHRSDRSQIWNSADIFSSGTCVRGRGNLVAILRREAVPEVSEGPVKEDIRQVATVRAARRSPRLVEAERKSETKSKVYSFLHTVCSPLISGFELLAC